MWAVRLNNQQIIQRRVFSTAVNMKWINWIDDKLLCKGFPFCSSVTRTFLRSFCDKRLRDFIILTASLLDELTTKGSFDETTWKRKPTISLKAFLIEILFKVMWTKYYFKKTATEAGEISKLSKFNFLKNSRFFKQIWNFTRRSFFFCFWLNALLDALFRLNFWYWNIFSFVRS